MSEIPRLNGVIKALEQGQTAFVAFTPVDIESAVAMAGTKLDGVAFEMEHAPLDFPGLRNALQFMLDRGQIVAGGTLAPAVTPMVRVPPNGIEMNSWIAKQVLDIGVMGIIFPHVSSVEEAANAVGACRYPRLKSAPRYHPPGIRGDAPARAARYWGLPQQEYYKRADVWPLAPDGEVLVVIQCEEMRAIENLPKILKEVPGIGVVLIGEGDLSQELGHPRDYDHPVVADAINNILKICKEHNVPCGHPAPRRQKHRALGKGRLSFPHAVIAAQLRRLGSRQKANGAKLNYPWSKLAVISYFRHSGAELAPYWIRGRNPHPSSTWIPFFNGMTDAVRHLDAGLRRYDGDRQKAQSKVPSPTFSIRYCPFAILIAPPSPAKPPRAPRQRLRNLCRILA